MNEWYTYVSRWTNGVYNGFALLTLLLLLLAWLWKNQGRLFRHLLLASNVLLLVTATCQWITGIYVLWCYRFFPLTPPPVRGNAIYIFLIIVYLVLPMAFWWRRLRNSHAATLLLAILMLAAIATERIATAAGTLQLDLFAALPYALPDLLQLAFTLAGYILAVSVISLFIRDRQTGRLS
ncbi:hypothetical protein [Taibaiella koreensis]|uniref:hypothetical protein n=1 Tax=Taibaiella koreensis TaxID=1268548 RepID=UPI000E59A6C7|nr:hypothetical protein [Taibaiella koreensis]